ncbi:hypothetical protein JCM9533A_32680 [Catenuloplanes niger JCM 9533]
MSTVSQPAHVTVARRGQERLQQPPVVGRVGGCAAVPGQVGAGAGDELPRVRLGHLEDLGDPAVRVVEGLAEHVGGAFPGAEPFQQHQHGEVEGLRAFGAERGVRAGRDRFRQPRSGVGLAARAGRR